MMELSRRKSLLSFAVITQIAFCLGSLIIVFYVSTLNFSGRDALLRALLIYLCHLVNFYVCYSVLVPRYFEKGQRWLAFAGLILLFVVLTPVRYYIEQQFLGHANTVDLRYMSSRKLRRVIVLSEITIAAIASLLRLAVSNEEKRTKMVELENLHLQTE